MELIASFQVDHTRLDSGVYVSRRDKVAGGYITTFDVRMKRPNREVALTVKAAHTIEHVVATYLRSSAFRDHVVYWGPMGCLTGFYFITFTNEAIKPSAVTGLLRAAFRYQAAFKGEIPGAKAECCGNYRLHDLKAAKREAAKFLKRKWALKYA